MKKMTIGLFALREEAEEAIDRLHRDLKIDNDDISYIYRNEEGELKEVDADDISSDGVGKKAGKGAVIGGSLGALAGLATAAGMIPVIGPIFAAGPLLAALGIGGATAAGAATGAAAGGLLGALVGWGVDEKKAQEYSDRVEAGDILVAVQTDEDTNALMSMMDAGAMEVNEYKLTV
jgi:hypothetical protein